MYQWGGDDGSVGRGGGSGWGWIVGEEGDGGVLGREVGVGWWTDVWV